MFEIILEEVQRFLMSAKYCSKRLLLRVSSIPNKARNLEEIHAENRFLALLEMMACNDLSLQY